MSDPRLRSASLRKPLPPSLSPSRVQVRAEPFGSHNGGPRRAVGGEAQPLPESRADRLRGNPEHEENMTHTPAFLGGKADTGVPQPRDREAGCDVAVLSSRRPRDKSICTSAGKGRMKRGQEREKAVLYPTTHPRCQAAEHEEVPSPPTCPTRPSGICFPSPRLSPALLVPSIKYLSLPEPT